VLARTCRSSVLLRRDSSFWPFFVGLLYAITMYREYVIFYSEEGTTVHGRQTLTSLSWYGVTLCKGLILEAQIATYWTEKSANIGGFLIIGILSVQTLLASFKATIDVMLILVSVLDAITWLSTLRFIYAIYKREMRKFGLVLVFLILYVTLSLSLIPIYIMENRKYGYSVDHWAPFIVFFGSISFGCMGYISAIFQERVASYRLIPESSFSLFKETHAYRKTEDDNSTDLPEAEGVYVIGGDEQELQER